MPAAGRGGWPEPILPESPCSTEPPFPLRKPDTTSSINTNGTGRTKAQAFWSAFMSPKFWSPTADRRRLSVTISSNSDEADGDADAAHISPPQSPMSPHPSVCDDRYKYFNERRYAKGQKYILPADDTEAQRLTAEHFLMKWLLLENFRSPMKELLHEGANILDVGCGTGCWSMENASEYLESEFYGFDIVPLFPSVVLPFNCHFLIHNINEKRSLPYPDDFFDFVFQRNLSMAVSQDRWVPLIDELVRITKPGGYIELVEWDLELKRRSMACEDWNDKLMFFMRSRGLVPRICVNLESLLHGSGLSNVQKKQFSCPLGEWGSAIGKQHRDVWTEFSMAAKPIVSASLEISDNDYDATLEVITADFDKYKTFADIVIVTGRKPFKGERSEKEKEIVAAEVEKEG